MKRIAIAASLLLVACSSNHNLSPAEQNNAELGAREYSQAATADFVNCSGIDSNGDGYVTCTMKDKTNGKLIEIVCAFGDGAKGCKLKA